MRDDGPDYQLAAAAAGAEGGPADAGCGVFSVPSTGAGPKGDGSGAGAGKRLGTDPDDGVSPTEDGAPSESPVE
jgi:hypothetical protein